MGKVHPENYLFSLSKIKSFLDQSITQKKNLKKEGPVGGILGCVGTEGHALVAAALMLSSSKAWW